jgi:hypothetical protein
MHDVVEKSLIRWLKRRGFRCIRTEQQLILNNTKLKPDIYAERVGIHGNEKYIFEVTISHLDFLKYLPLTEQGFKLFLVVPHSDYLTNERISIYEIKRSIDIVGLNTTLKNIDGRIMWSE